MRMGECVAIRNCELVEDIKAFTAEAVADHREKGLAVRLLMQRDPAVRGAHTTTAGATVQTLDPGADVEQALGTKKETVTRAARILDQAQVTVELALGAASSEGEVLRVALGVEAGGDGDRLDEGRLTGSVVADQEGALGVELQLA